MSSRNPLIFNCCCLLPRQQKPRCSLALPWPLWKSSSELRGCFPGYSPQSDPWIKYNWHLLGCVGLFIQLTLRDLQSAGCTKRSQFPVSSTADSQSMILVESWFFCYTNGTDLNFPIGIAGHPGALQIPDTCYCSHFRNSFHSQGGFFFFFPLFFTACEDQQLCQLLNQFCFLW